MTPSPGPVPVTIGRSHRSDTLVEADRLMVICNSCRYCEGLCAVFPAMERRRTFEDADLEFLANLCHNCGACLYDCQYAPPHEFAVNVPANLAQLRSETWQQHCWPRPLAGLFRRNFAATSLLVVAAVIALLIGAWVTNDSLVETHRGPGAFYEVVPHDTIVAVFLAGFGYAVLAIAISMRRYWRAMGGGRAALADFAVGGRSASTLEYLDGGGVGCMNEDDTPNDNRRVFHHMTYYGFAACLASTTLAAILESGFDREAPYALYHPVVLLGALGGLGLVVGPAGLWWAKRRRAPELGDPSSRSMELTFLALLALLSISGFATLVLRATSAMPIALVLHLGVVLGFFVSMPYGKFVHGFYRYAALVRDAMERRTAAHD